MIDDELREALKSHPDKVTESLVHDSVPLVLLEGEEVVVTVEVSNPSTVRRTPLAIRRIGNLRAITSLAVHVEGVNRFGDRHEKIVGTPWRSVEDIANYVAGDGTDAQRVALADGIRASAWNKKT